MATHSSVLAWRIPGTGEPGGLPSMGSHRVGPDWSDLAAAAAAGLPVPNPSQHQGLSDSMDMSLSNLRELVMDREVWCAAIGWSQSRTRLSDWTELNWTELRSPCFPLFWCPEFFATQCGYRSPSAPTSQIRSSPRRDALSESACGFQCVVSWYQQFFIVFLLVFLYYKFKRQYIFYTGNLQYERHNALLFFTSVGVCCI